jgi:hypothetical protein
MKQKIALKDKRNQKTNGKFNNIDSANENKYKNITAEIFFVCQNLKSRVFFIQLKPNWIFSCMVSVSPAALNTVWKVISLLNPKSYKV